MVDTSMFPDGFRSRRGQDRRTVLVTGGAGFLGSHLVDALLGMGADVYVVDNLRTGRLENLHAAFATGRTAFLKRDVVEALPEGLPRFDEIYNLACPASPPHYQNDPVATALTCSQGVWNLLQRAEQDGSRVFQASTSEVYGDPEVHPQTEGYWGRVNPIGPRSCYDEGKRFAETLATDFSRTRGVSLRIARIFNTYGPRMDPDDGRVVSNFVTQALRQAPLTIYGDGSQTRSFCFVSDLIDGILRLMHAEDPGSPVNLGNPDEWSVSEFADLVIKLTGSSSRIQRYPRPTDDPVRRRPDITLAAALLEWHPTVGIREGLSETIAYFSQNQSRLAA